jgi:preprotein translocase subunit SecA
VEAKERVLVKEENQTLATITLQNYFRLYKKLSGMTGTAMTEDSEFRQIYKLPVMAIPSNRPVIRVDHVDLVYRTLEAKYRAVATDIAERHAAGQPTLVGTVSIENSELLSRLLDKRGIPHEVLNAKHHEREAHIVAQAGRVGAVTIATNMAGRGTDILLGGNPDFLADELLANAGISAEEASEADLERARVEAEEITREEHEQVVAAGGLCVIGTERHEARRIDNQLRGRSGRQGDPGATQFYLSLEDDLMRLFGGDRMERVSNLMQRTNLDDDVPIENNMVSKAIESAQRQVESMHFDSRKRVLEYDDVMNLQRAAIYKERNAILDGKDIHQRALEIIEDTVRGALETYGAAVMDDWDWDGLNKWLQELTGIETASARDLITTYDDEAAFGESLLGYLEGVLAKKEETLGAESLRRLETQVMLRIMDTRWMNHMQEMDYLKQGIGLRAFGQRDPLTEYKSEAHAAFGLLRDTMYEDFLRTILRIQIAISEEQAPSPLAGARYSGPSEDVPSVTRDARMQAARQYAQQQGAAAAAATGRGQAQPGATKTATIVKDKDDPFANVGRNDPCPCGSGKKYKNCCMRTRQ